MATHASGALAHAITPSCEPCAMIVATVQIIFHHLTILARLTKKIKITAKANAGGMTVHLSRVRVLVSA